MNTATLKTNDLLRRLNNAGINANFEQAETLRRCELALAHWGEKECGDSNNYNSFGIERDETTGKPYMVVRPHTNNRVIRYAIPDREKGALRRIAAICKELGIYYYHQTDPRGCALYVSSEPLPENNYTRGISCCE